MSNVFELNLIFALIILLCQQGCKEATPAKRTIRRSEAKILIHGFQNADELTEAMTKNNNWPPAAHVLPLGLQTEPGTVKLSVRGEIWESDLAGIRLSVEQAFRRSSFELVHVSVTHKVEGKIYMKEVEMNFQR